MISSCSLIWNTKVCYSKNTPRWGDCAVGSSSSCPVSEETAPSCTTVGGPAANTACVFPFTVNGVTYNTCKMDGKVKTACYTTMLWGVVNITSCQYEGLDEPWCSTATTVDSSHITGQGQYGECSTQCGAQCVTDSGAHCVFPFTWGGVTHTQCTEWSYGGTSQGQYWCSTK